MRSKAVMIVTTTGRVTVTCRKIALSTTVVVRNAAGDREAVAA